MKGMWMQICCHALVFSILVPFRSHINDVEKATRKAIKAAKSKHRLISFDPNYRPVLWPGEEEARKWMLYGCSVCDILKSGS